MESDPLQRGEPVALRAIVCEDLELARRFEAALATLYVPSESRPRVDGRALLVVPEPFFSKAWNTLMSIQRVECVGEGDDERLRLAAEAPAAQPANALDDHPVLRESREELLQRGQSALDDLDRCLSEGSDAVQRRAWKQVERLGEAAITLHAKSILESVREGSLTEARGALEISPFARQRGGPLPELLHAVRTAANDSAANVRQAAIQTLASFPDAASVPILAVALLDPEPMVAIEADDAFLEWGAEDLGFDPEMDPNEKKALAERRARFTPKPQR